MNHFGKRLLAFSLALGMTGVLAACGGGGIVDDVGTVKLRLSEVTHSVFYAPQYVALEKGFFAEEGLEVELINGGGADKVMVSVLTGEAEIGLAGPEASIYTLLEGRE
ncbi:MAG: ABC transporter substrate-binding protein, partial [Oscillospiraceae bacterium]|nr:ABC transporter substrate-binding protein [Oscillospiraceae bacterium]